MIYISGFGFLFGVACFGLNIYFGNITAGMWALSSGLWALNFMLKDF